jgi:hypothetical protein
VAANDDGTGSIFVCFDELRSIQFISAALMQDRWCFFLCPDDPK